MRTRAARFTGAEHVLRERGRLFELDDDLVDRNVGAAEVAEVPFDPFAGADADFQRLRDELIATGGLLDVDADRNRSHGRMIDIVGTDETVR